MKKLSVLLVVSTLTLFVFAGCEGLLPSGSELAETAWKLSSWSEGSLDPSQFTITAHFDDSTIFGTSAINSYSGSYIAVANHYFSVGDLQMTLMGGSEEAMHAESTYFQLLQETCQYTVNQTTLTLFDALGKELLIFSKIVPMVGFATVEEIDIFIAESHPVLVFVVAKGYLPNPCTEIGPIIQQREGNSFYLTIKTYSYQEICIELITPFTETISLDVYGLPAGKYTVDVNGIQGSFVLDMDNIPIPSTNI